ncbi:metal-dependent hydrolase [Neolewinella litorea]|uniref:Metal-dependent hydrolase n=1 Tax=Neolewinella litorea TaxID=2562452 RepID=A0A4S4NE12_9BACT|nr:metal-dependent hydrolase [Neolewinella litorea]THH37762.1 metal-dependent hydrolase [Neolewinella litorea]
MDSLTQIVLGAAVGEAALGRKVGNRALLWGGIAGTLPDLDVFARLVTDPMSALAYHRAFTHSLPFAVLAAPIIGLAVHRLYGGKSLPRVSTPIVFAGALLALWLLLFTGSFLMPVEVYHLPEIAVVVTLVFASICSVVGLWVYLRRRRLRGPNTSARQWSWLFFLTIVTHPLLDCFTAYGTQFLQPFTALRIAWNTISVVDPLYTLPFLLLLVWAARLGRGTRVRRRINTAGLVVSSAYLLLTVVNHLNVSAVLDQTLVERDLTAARSIHSPSIGNNLLWSATAQVGRDSFYVGQYSLLDRQRRFVPFQGIAGHHDWLDPYAGDRELEILRWFTQGYFVVLPRDSGHVQLSDLRYGILGTDPADPDAYIFSWKIDTTIRPVRVVQQSEGPQREREGMLGQMWERMKGI